MDRQYRENVRTLQNIEFLRRESVELHTIMRGSIDVLNTFALLVRSTPYNLTSRGFYVELTT